MAILQAEIKRGFLRSLFRQCPEDTAFLSALEGFQDYCLASGGLKSGKLISATSQAGHSVQYQAPSMVTSFTPDQVFSLSEELLQVYVSAKASLVANGVATPSDQQIFDAMLSSNDLATVTEEVSDYAGANYSNRIL